MIGHAFFTTELTSLFGREHVVPVHKELPAHHGLAESEKRKLLAMDKEIRIAQNQREARQREYWLKKNQQFKPLGESRKNGKRSDDSSKTAETVI